MNRVTLNLASRTLNGFSTTDIEFVQQVAAQMQEFFAKNKMNLLVQGGGAPRDWAFVVSPRRACIEP